MIKKIIRLGTLLTIKESYLLTKNVVGLGIHPYKTLRVLQREKDRSQELLLWMLPVVLLGLGLIWPAIIIVSYLFFWWTRVWLKK